MSELIDRQALIKQLKDENIPFNADINEIINIQPISFDTENVVSQLDEYLIKLVGRKSALYQTVIGIVKKGGIEWVNF